MPVSDLSCPAFQWGSDAIAPADNVVEHLRRSAQPGRRILLTGPAGSGRSATLRCWLKDVDANTFSHLHAAGHYPEYDYPAGVIYGLLQAIRSHIGATDALPLDESGLREALAGWLARLCGQKALVVIDNLDRITGSDLTGEPDWLPAYLPPGLTLVASTERGLLSERLRALGWEVVDMNRPAQWDSTALASQIEAATTPASRSTLRHLSVAPAGLATATLDALGLNAETLPTELVAIANEGVTFAHPLLREAAKNQLIEGSMDERSLNAAIAAVTDEPGAHCRWLARAADWAGLLEVLAEPEQLLQWNAAPFFWQSLWSELPARDTAISHLMAKLQALRESTSYPAEKLARCHINAGRILDQLDASDAALAVRRAAHQQLSQRAPGSLAAAAAAHQYAATDLNEEDPAAAADLLETALNIRESQLGADANDTRSTRHARAAALEATGDLDAAIAAYAQVVAEREKSLGREDPRLIPLLSNLGAALRAANQLERARGPFERCVKLARSASPGASPALAAALDNLAGLLYSGHDYEGAESRYREAVDITQTLFGPGHSATAAAIHNLGTALDAREQFSEAQRCFRKAVEIRTGALGREHAETATSLHNLAGVLDVVGQREEAEKLYREAIEIWRAVVGNDHPATATSINNLADLLRESGRLDEAEPLYQENLALWRNLYGDDHPNTAMTAAELGGLYADDNRPELAEPLLRDAVSRLERMLGVDNSLHVDSLCRLAMVMRRQGRLADGITLLQQAYERAAGTTRVLSPAMQKLRRHLDGLRKAAEGGLT